MLDRVSSSRFFALPFGHVDLRSVAVFGKRAQGVVECETEQKRSERKSRANIHMNHSLQLPSRGDRVFLSLLVLEFTTHMKTMLSVGQETETTISMTTRLFYILREERECYGYPRLLRVVLLTKDARSAVLERTDCCILVPHKYTHC
jgi:hypothetical protein